MPIEDCGICETLNTCGGEIQQKQFPTIATKLLCCIAEAVEAGAITGDAEILVLCDDNAGVATPFIRTVTITNGVKTVADTTLDGTTPYVPTGTVGQCPKLDSEFLILCDDDGMGVVTLFLRRISADETGLVSIVDTEIDGTTPYVVGGTVSRCRDNDGFIPLCDDNAGVITPFVRLFRSQGGLPEVGDFELDLMTPYTVTGTVVLCPTDVTAPIAATATISRISTTTSGSVAIGKQSAFFTNVGGAAGTVLGVSIEPGEEIGYEAYLDPVVGEYRRLPAIAYDATGTTFHIAWVD